MGKEQQIQKYFKPTGLRLASGFGLRDLKDNLKGNLKDNLKKDFEENFEDEKKNLKIIDTDTLKTDLLEIEQKNDLKIKDITKYLKDEQKNDLEIKDITENLKDEQKNDLEIKDITKYLKDEQKNDLEIKNIIKDKECKIKLKDDKINVKVDERKSTEYRTLSLSRARMLVSSALKNVSRDTVNKQKAIFKDEKDKETKNMKNRMAVRKRLFEETSEDESKELENQVKYKKLKSQLPKVPAFKRFKHMLESPSKLNKIVYPFETNFPLPPLYEKLFQFYKSADSVLFIMHQRKEPCGFLKLKKMVEAITHKSFEKSDFAKILNIRPKDFKVYINENPNGLTRLENDGNKKPMLMIVPDYKEALEKLSVSISPITDRYDKNIVELSPVKYSFIKQSLNTPLIYSPNLRSPLKCELKNESRNESISELKCEDIFRSPTKLKLDNKIENLKNDNIDNFKSPQKTINNVKLTVRPSHLTWRRDQMRLTLLKKTHDQHYKFLQKINVFEDIDYSMIKKWHAQFDLNNVEKIEEIILPDEKKYKLNFTAKDILENTEIKLNTTMTKIIKNVVDENLLNKSSNIEIDDSSSGVSSLNFVCQKVLKSIPSKMIQRIKEKEKHNLKLEMLIKNDSENYKSMLEKLPSLLKILFNYLRSEKKTCMLLSKVVEKIQQSTLYTLSLDSMEKHIIMLSEIVPDIVTIPIIGQMKFIKIVQIKCTIQNAISIIEKKIKDL